MKKDYKMRRYEQFAAIIEDIKPQTVVEIGTHRALRGTLMSALALRHRPKVHYTGFDIFEGGDREFNDQALNSKGLPTVERAQWALRKIERNYEPGQFTWELVKGDTRETLAGKSLAADLVFIDGDHRLETIRSDYAAVRESHCVVFDDYLLAGLNGELPDLSLYGANRLVDELYGEILPIIDCAVKGGWNTALAMVKRSSC